MPLLYRSILDDPTSELCRRAEQLFWYWLDSKGIPADRETARGDSGWATCDHRGYGASVEHRRATVPGPRRSVLGRAERFRLTERRPEGTWRTTITTFSPPPKQLALGDEDSTNGNALFALDEVGLAAWVWVDLVHEPSSPELVVRPGSPRIVRELMALGDAHDSGVPLTAEPLRVAESHVNELAKHVLNTSRHVPVLVFAHDPTRSYDQDLLTESLARDLAGVASVFVLTDAVTNEALARVLPDGYGVYGGALRTYYPGVGAEGDTPTRHRVLGRTSIRALGRRAFPAVRDQVLRLSAERPTPPLAGSLRRLFTDLEVPPLAAEPAPPGQLERFVRWINMQTARLRLGLGFDLRDHPPAELSPAQRLLELEIDRAIAREAQDPAPPAGSPAPAEDPQLLARLDKAEKDRGLLEQLLEESESERAELDTRLRESADDNGILQLELADESQQLERLARRNRYLETRLRELGEAAVGEDDSLPPAPSAVADVVSLARELLGHLVIGAIEEEAAMLDLSPAAEGYAAKSWAALCALNSYATARSSQRFAGSFYQWCQERPAGEYAVSANAVAMRESELVATNPDLRAKRTFRVPVQVDPSGEVYMDAHIRIVRRGTPCPRLHFHDDSGGATGKVYVGYLGEHLPTWRYRS